MPDWTKTTLNVNGRTYSSVDEMPPDVRRQYEQVMAMMADKNGNGVPDVLEGQPTGEGTVVTQVTTSTRSFVNGREASAGELPVTFRRLQSMAQPGEPVVSVRPWTLLALLATVAVLAAAGMWWVMR